MTDQKTPRLPARPPAVAPPPPVRERRTAYRRAEDRRAHQERILLAQALDVIASGASPEERLAGLLDLLARTAGATRAAVLADGIERRSAVSVDEGEDPTAAEALAAWLDASAGRSRAERAAAGRAPVSVVVRGAEAVAAAPVPGPADRPVAPRPPAAVPRGDALPTTVVASEGDHWYALLAIPSAGQVFLGFEFDGPDGPDHLAGRLPPQLARHAAVALALVSEQLAADRELTALRARVTERTRFVSTVAHELRTPLTGLRGYLELILGDKVDDPAIERDFLERSRGIVGSMAELVGDLLELSRLESGTIALEEEPFSVAEAASHVAASLMPIALERGSRLTTSLPPRLRTATGDGRRVEQILTNLAGNALKFTPPGGTVEIVGRFDGPVAVFVVRDDGPGIAEEDRTRIFERFHRLADHERVTGTGLGLPIARDLARRMEGDLDVSSLAGSGSAFVLVLPGPAPVDAASIDDCLRRVLAAELSRLEELAVLRTARQSRLEARTVPGEPEHAPDSGPEAAPPTAARGLPAAAPNGDPGSGNGHDEAIPPDTVATAQRRVR
jgi:signal transduction histidine kinase